ncbi:MAG: hypothetical protein JW939_00930 [Candidatus Thermoplasmatota archaeon]|nr:hypothetical protein [Candidatus Thermoplasmatota archaeon]
MVQRKEALEKTCEVSGCREPAVRSISIKKAKASGLSLEGDRGNVHLCKEHYKEFKRSTREDRKLQRLGW